MAKFQPGNKFSKGRKKGTENKFGPGFREKLLAGIIKSGEKKARKNGVNGKVDGFSYFVESLVDGNGGAAATLIAKMLPPEQPPEAFAGPGLVVNVHSVSEGQQFTPGPPEFRVLMPFEEAGKAWVAYNAGPEAWATYLASVEGSLTKAAYENLCRVEALDRKVLTMSEAPLLRVVPDGQIELQTSAEERPSIEDELSNMTIKQALEQVRARGLCDMTFNELRQRGLVDD